LSVLDKDCPCQEKISVVFFGSGPVAAASLALLLDSFDVEAVVTKPRPPHHRGSVPVLELAEQKGLAVVETSDKKELSSAVAAASFKSRVAILIDFGIIVTQDVIDAFPLGIVNSHFSLLPEWRGADPITFSILSGQERTGVSLMLLVEKMDEGPLLAQAPYDITPGETTPSLTEALIQLSYESLQTVLPLYIANQTQPAPQESVTMADTPNPTYSRKLTKEDGVLDFTKPAAVLEREVRAFAEWPKSRTVIAGKDVVITSAHVTADESGVGLRASGVGKAYVDTRQLCITTSEGVLVIDTLKPAGKPDMRGDAFVNGYIR
jgi:methionyl-tRNA formyltransferase